MGLTRRFFLQSSGAGIAGASVAVLAGCEEQGGPSVGGDAFGDVSILEDALAIELGLAAAYAFAAGEMDGDAGETMELFAKQSSEHADALRKALEERGADAPDGLSPEEYERELEVEKLSDDQAILDFGVDLESTALAAYGEAVTQLSDARLRRLVFEILGNSAAHVSVLLGLLGEVQVPDSFVTGAQT